MVRKYDLDSQKRRSEPSLCASRLGGQLDFPVDAAGLSVALPVVLRRLLENLHEFLSSRYCNKSVFKKEDLPYNFG